MNETGKWIVIVGGVVAVIGNFWGGGADVGTQYYLPAIGGALAIIGAFIK